MLAKPVAFTRHARERMADAERGTVNEDDVLAVLANPQANYTGLDGKPNVLGEVNGKRLRICFVEDESRILVITVINRGEEQ